MRCVSERSGSVDWRGSGRASPRAFAHTQPYALPCHCLLTSSSDSYAEGLILPSFRWLAHFGVEALVGSRLTRGT